MLGEHGDLKCYISTGRQHPGIFSAAAGGAKVELGLAPRCARPRRGGESKRRCGRRALAHRGSLPQPRPSVGGDTGVLEGILDLVASLRDDASPYALCLADPEASGTPTASFADTVASSGADSTNRQDARYFDGYWSRFYDEQNTSRLRNGVAANRR